MKHQLIWDLPTRLFHWLLAGGFVLAAFIALVLGDDGPLFPYHAILGLIISLAVCLRVVWGVIGTRYALFGSFVFGPGAVLEYMKGALAGGGRRYVGHNPGSSLAIFGLLALVLAMAVTGIMLGQGNEGVKEIHEVLAYVTVAAAIIHVLGVILHTIRHRENITASMIHGAKVAEPSEAIPSSRPIVAVIFMAVVGAWGLGLVRNFDSLQQTTTIPLIGTVLQLGENEGGPESEGPVETGGEDDDD